MENNKVDIQLKTIPWDCACCGNGYHVSVEITHKGKTTTYSKDDQFGGVLNKGTDLELSELTNGVSYIENMYEFLLGYKEALEGFGYEVALSGT
jgi:hypothetical protein